MSQNIIRKTPIGSLGYDFVPAHLLRKGRDEYFLRNLQNRSGIEYRQLTAYEIEVLVRNGNTSDDWNGILVSNAFNPELVKNCTFHGLVRIGKLESFCLEFSDLRLPVGLYNSVIISCDFGDNVVVNNVSYFSHYIIGNEVMIVNVSELVTTDHAKFGNGILKQGERESVRIQMEVCNENGGRAILPFNGMLPGDAYLWSQFRDDEKLLDRFRQFTEESFSSERGYYGKVGDRTVIKDCQIIKDVWIGSDAYLKGANKLKNLTINSGEEGRTQIGEGCEMVNGIVGEGCRIFYGVKAVRFFMASHSQLKYGARLINSYLGNNATISCCEVLNALIFPAHEQHHNNSFLCAALVMGQSNMAAGATIGSNHNSRSADGEIIAGRGFWPGLCVSLKHNSVFAGFTIVAKSDYSSELNIPLPFSLVSNDPAKDRLVVMPAYWFLYNMYALARNSWKYRDRDRRKVRVQSIEYDYLAPDTVNEMLAAIRLLETLTGKAWYAKEQPGPKHNEEALTAKGRELLENGQTEGLEITAPGFENSSRKCLLLKVAEAWRAYRRVIIMHGIEQLIEWQQLDGKRLLPPASGLPDWTNVGGQLIPKETVAGLLNQIRTRKITSWKAIHSFYIKQGAKYPALKARHAFAALVELTGLPLRRMRPEHWKPLFDEAIACKKWMVAGIRSSREKDYSNPFRQMTYRSQKEMDAVLGKLESNSFIIEQENSLPEFISAVSALKKKFISSGNKSAAARR